MASSSSSSRKQRRTCDYTYEGTKFCNCVIRGRRNRPAPRFFSWTPNNPCRRFYGCIDYKDDGGCNFFEWHDGPMSEREKNVMNALIEKREQSLKAGPDIVADELEELWYEVRILKKKEQCGDYELMVAKKKLRWAYMFSAFSSLVILCMLVL
ncbi:uncharacterized protein LOC126654830 [Mercurialis annua]|uniref:uncharacterized protein LOC126654830 n=1 Tax=Mercurialis annua TaxID=3986 RepID=UPI00215F705A|nr:uncharacterized protein LOC126654830 [Mercurialis annua]